MIRGLWFDSLQPFLPCSWQQYVLLSLCTTGKYFTPLQQIWAGLTLRYSPQSLGGGKTTHPCSQRCCPAWFTLLQWKISCGCNVNQNLPTWEGWLSKETSDAWRHFLLADYLGGVRSPSLSLSLNALCCGSWLAILCCLKLGKWWPPEANSCRSCNIFVRLLNQIFRGFIWKHLSTQHKLSRCRKTYSKACSKKETWMIVNKSFLSGRISLCLISVDNQIIVYSCTFS